MGYEQQPGMTGDASAGGQYDDLDTVDSLQYGNIAAESASQAAQSAAEAEQSAIDAAISAVSANSSANTATTSASTANAAADSATLSAANALNYSNSASESADDAAQSAIDAADASRLTLGTVTTGLPGSEAVVEITGVAGSQTISFEIPSGVQGPQGIQGIQGPQGIKGDTGEQGLQGIQGIKGDTGATGATGPQGLQGIQGLQGLQGLQGIQGVKGDTGDTGPSNVLSIGTVNSGASSSATITGTSPSQVLNLILEKGDNGSNGRGIVSIYRTSGEGNPGEVDTYTVTYTDSTTYDFEIYNGADGATGPQGIQGIQGDTGATGEQGPQGIQGIKGDTGEQGPQGVKGDTGDDGRGIVSVVRTSGTGAAGTTDTYTITYTDASTSTFNVYNGANGTGVGDMLKSENLSGLTNYTTARNNLGLGTAAVTDSTAYATAAQGLLADSAVQDASVDTLTNKTIDSITNKIGADHIHFKIKATESISKGNVLKSVGWNAGEDALEVAKVSSSADIAIGVSHDNLTTGSFGAAINTGILEGINTSTFAEGSVLYPNISGGFTTTKPSSGSYQALAYVLRSSSSNGTILIEATEPNEVLSLVATTGSYNDLLDKPTIPSAYTNSDVDAHLNTSTATANQTLVWSGTDYSWVGQLATSGGINSIAIVSALPGSPSANTLYIVTGV